MLIRECVQNFEMKPRRADTHPRREHFCTQCEDFATNTGFFAVSKQNARAERYNLVFGRAGCVKIIRMLPAFGYHVRLIMMPRP